MKGLVTNLSQWKTDMHAWEMISIMVLFRSWKYYTQFLKATMQNKMSEKGASKSGGLHSCKSIDLWKELTFICVWHKLLTPAFQPVNFNKLSNF